MTEIYHTGIRVATFRTKIFFLLTDKWGSYGRTKYSVQGMNSDPSPSPHPPTTPTSHLLLHPIFPDFLFPLKPLSSFPCFYPLPPLTFHPLPPHPTASRNSPHHHISHHISSQLFPFPPFEASISPSLPLPFLYYYHQSNHEVSNSTGLHSCSLGLALHSLRARGLESQWPAHPDLLHQSHPWCHQLDQ